MQPALGCGYRFEDDAFVDEMLRDIQEERGALPLMAFAAARLWELRDREGGVLSRAGYETSGGVGGALAHHAEATLSAIGANREPIVREIFRNLVTAQGTRVARDREELLSVFEDPQAAGGVLTRLVDARLLTAFDVAPSDAKAVTRQRIEIIHESLFTSWPRLVRWQTQDLDGAQLRDQLRQASELWNQPRPTRGLALDRKLVQRIRAVAGALSRRPRGDGNRLLGRDGEARERP